MLDTQPDFQSDEFLLDHYVGKTPLVRLQRLASHTQATVLAKLEGNNPAGSVKDRPAYNMIMQAEKRGEIQPGDTLIEATSGNTGIALAMVAAMRGYKMQLIMPDFKSVTVSISKISTGKRIKSYSMGDRKMNITIQYLEQRTNLSINNDHHGHKQYKQSLHLDFLRQFLKLPIPHRPMMCLR